MSRGHTLLELATVLAVLTAAVSVITPALGRQRDLAAVVTARESLAGMLARARVVAVARGGARVVVDGREGALTLLAGSDTLRTVRLGELGVTVELGRREVAVLAYDAVGIGRLANATVRLRRGEAVRALVVSSHGRVRRP